MFSNFEMELWLFKTKICLYFSQYFTWNAVHIQIENHIKEPNIFLVKSIVSKIMYWYYNMHVFWVRVFALVREKMHKNHYLVRENFFSQKRIETLKWNFLCFQQWILVFGIKMMMKIYKNWIWYNALSYFTIAFGQIYICKKNMILCTYLEYERNSKSNQIFKEILQSESKLYIYSLIT